MTLTVLALVPLTATAFYAWLFVVVFRGARDNRGAPEFLLHLGLLGSWSGISLMWRLSQDAPSAEYLLRALELPLFSIPATFLYFLQAFYPTRFSRAARRLAVISTSVVTVAAMSGAINRLGVDAVPPTEAWPYVLFYGALFGALLTYAAAFGYVAHAIHVHRDVFDQNRLRWVAVATTLTMIGSITNLIEALRLLPVDQAANAAAATLLAVTIARFRLLDINVVLRRGAIHAVTAVMAATLYGLGTLLASSITGVDVFTREGLLATVAFVWVLGTFSSGFRGGAEALVDRTFIGSWSRLDAPIAELTRRTSRLQSLEDLARGTVQVVQRAVESSYVALLVAREGSPALSLIAQSGPFPVVTDGPPIDVDNEVLALIAERDEPVTPLQLTNIVSSGAFDEGAVAAFAPYRDAVLVPVHSHDRLAGLLLAEPKIFDEAFVVADLELLAAAAGRTGLALENARIFDHLRAMGHTDYLTSLPNHRHLQALLEDAIARADATGQPLSVAMIDVDNFKLLNDVHGHQTGDDALRRLAEVMREPLRDGDVLGRYGGDEFLLIVPGLEPAAAEDLVSQVARRVRKTPLSVADGDLTASILLPARISWGVAAYPQDGNTPRSLTSKADSELMQAKIRRQRSGTVNATRPSVSGLLETDPQKVRIASSLLDLINAKDPYTSEHSQQIASFALLVAAELDLPERNRHALWLGSLLHDVGKLSTPVEVLRKPGRLTPEEWTAMHEHPLIGESMVRGLLEIDEVTAIVGGHHERWDGTGYPRGLAGEEIAPLVRLVSVADTFSAMVHDRPYRRGLSWSEAALELRRAAGTQLEPEAVETFIRALGIEVAAVDAA